jgi:UDP-N-acetylmuramoyl-L-alanyl-D-glutamate--2,6-diaminopimelate ligase
VTVVEVADTRKALAHLTAEFYGHPSDRFRLIGVTGTNGKTTTTYLIRQVLRAAGRRVGLLGTIQYDLDGERLPAPHTTPDPTALQPLFLRMADRGLTDVVMEVSSHALELDRVTGCEFDLAVFTNLTQDHLEFHKTMENYFSAKERLFLELGREARKPGPKRAVINRDDPWGRLLLDRTKAPAWSYGLSPEADIRAQRIEMSLEGLRFEAHTPKGVFPVRSPLLGQYNVYNLLAAIGAGLSLEIPVESVTRGLSELSSVPGRFERIEAGQDFSFIVDYAHTEDALHRLLEAVASLSPRRIITVFGCGGDRDPGKRAPMGRVAARLSDRVILTSDNPRSEDPLSIIEQIEAGVKEAVRHGARTDGYEVRPDRRKAIERAVELAGSGDAIVLAGKGHEDYQLIGPERLFFDDRVAAREAIQKRREAASR